MIMPRESLYRGNPSHNICAFTFDDGPNTLPVELWLDALEQGGAIGTFFFTGEWIDRHPAKAREIMTRGHILAPHSYHHRRMDQVPKPVFFEELRLTELAYQEATGLPCPTFMRFPYYSYTAETLEWLAEWGYTDIEGDDSGDWAGITASEIVDIVQPVLQNGSIVIQHSNDIAKESPNALKILIRSAYEKGLTPVGVPEMMKSAGIRPGHRSWKISIETPAAVEFSVEDWRLLENDQELRQLAYETAEWNIPQYTSAFQSEREWCEHLASPLQTQTVTEDRDLFSVRHFSESYWGYLRAGVREQTLVLMDYAAKEAQADTLVYLLRWAAQQAQRLNCDRIEARLDIRRMDIMCRQLGWKSEIMPG
jgi:peptidoglycan/xylan/chitin deacetylase (PgdA/CDA1 family)